MKLDTTNLRYLTQDDFRVLQSIEQGTKNHELVPTQLIHSLSGLKSPARTNRAIGDLAKLKLISRLRNAKYDGFRLGFSGYDFLALKSMLKRETLYSVGTKIGVGKESDIYSVSDTAGTQKVLKIHRLGRTSFRTVKNNRDYLRSKHSSNWMYLSKLAANKEYQFMTVLYEHGFSVPEPFDYSRHCVLMEWIKGVPMKQLRESSCYKKLYSDLMRFIVELANHGLIHCDFNEFNIIICEKDGDVKDSLKFIVIDFPQCVSIEHTDAKRYFDRDVDGIRSYFKKRFKYVPEHDSTMYETDGYGDGYRYAYPNFKRDVHRSNTLDVEVQASGYSKKKLTKKEDKDLEGAVREMRINDDSEDSDNQSDHSEIDIENSYDDESEDDYSYDEDLEDDFERNDEDDVNKNEKIIEAISSGSDNLKMDKLGNYILEDSQ
ncbi:uncharacterized protein PRCAT00005172001 [Priceomyces carsonii]|uniref:uncharacterized protein n=1 Tax=Priceomyces carsonii TaxID=28549 RepID=UPI002ED7BFD6|nr:unnamed protein product [Priceomyces carsonii]